MTILFCSHPFSCGVAGPRACQRALAAVLSAWLGLALFAAAAAEAPTPAAPPAGTPSPLQQAHQTDLVLQQLGAPTSDEPPAAQATPLTEPPAATTPTLAVRPASARPRLTTATVTLRPKSLKPDLRPALPPAQGATPFSSATLARLTIPVLPLELARMLALPELFRGLSKTSATLPLAALPGLTAPGGVRINSADEQELRTRLKLDGIRARNIIEFRTHYGPFKHLDDLSQVSGITQEMVKKWDDQNLLFFK